MDIKSLPGYNPWGCKELDMTQRLNNNHHIGEKAESRGHCDQRRVLVSVDPKNEELRCCVN